MLKDIGHPYRQGRARSTTSRSRTCRPASAPATCSGWPTSTAASSSAPATCSELALGWCTYGVGDHMSHYNVNASVPKTLIQHLVRWVAETGGFGAEVQRVLRRVLETEISPELVPGKADRADAAPRRHRAVRAAGLPSLLHAALRLRADQGGVPQPGTRGSDKYNARARSASGSASSCSASSRPASSSAAACRTRRRSARAARCRRAATGARPAMATPTSG